MTNVITQQQSRARKLIVRLWDWIQDNVEAWESHHKTFEKFEILYAIISFMILTYQKIKNRTAKVRKTLLIEWSICDYYILRYSIYILISMRRYMMIELIFENYLLMIVRAVSDRMFNSRREVSSQLSSISDDWNRVIDEKYQSIFYKSVVLRNMNYKWKNSMLLSIIFVFLSRDIVVSSNQTTQTNDNVEEKSSK
jgi:hypothetical protein